VFPHSFPFCVRPDNSAFLLIFYFGFGMAVTLIKGTAQALVRSWRQGRDLIWLANSTVAWFTGEGAFVLAMRRHGVHEAATDDPLVVSLITLGICSQIATSELRSEMSSRLA
jgi:hypothetical protein